MVKQRNRNSKNIERSQELAQITRDIQQLIRTRQWDDALAQISTTPEVARIRCSRSNETTLGQLVSCTLVVKPVQVEECILPPDLILMKALIEINPGAILELSPKTGKNPLHTFSLFTSYSSRNYETNLRPIDKHRMDILRLMVEKAKPEGLEIPSQLDGWLPLHYACSQNATKEVLTILASPNPSTILMKTKGGVSPLSLLWDRSAMNDEYKCRLSPIRAAEFHYQSGRDEHKLNDDDTIDDDSGRIWQKMLFLIRSLHYGTAIDVFENNSDSEQCKIREGLYALYAFAAVRDVSFEMMKFAVAVHGNDIAQTIDQDGNNTVVTDMDFSKNTLLHQTVSINRRHCMLQERSNVDIIKLILKLNPKATRKQNSQHKYPLTVAIESGIEWEDGLKDIFLAFPEALMLRDTTSHLYPCMLAAACPSMDVMTVFHLLRSYPSVIE